VGMKLDMFKITYRGGFNFNTSLCFW
jgi:hypothetical protein